MRGLRSFIGLLIVALARKGIGFHHAGLLPKYRLLVEKLAGRYTPWFERLGWKKRRTSASVSSSISPVRSTRSRS